MHRNSNGMLPLAARSTNLILNGLGKMGDEADKLHPLIDSLVVATPPETAFATCIAAQQVAAPAQTMEPTAKEVQNPTFKGLFVLPDGLGSSRGLWDQ